MKRLVPFVFRPWLLPLVVAALVVPGSLAFAIGGPPLGLATGALTIGVLLTVAARTSYDRPIEVAASPDRGYRILVVALEPLAEPSVVERIASIAAEGRQLVGGEASPELLVLAPAHASTLDRWASDLDQARHAAQRTLAISIAALATAGLEATGRVGDPDPVQAIEDELHTYPARELVLVDGPGLGSSEVEQVRRRLDRPVRELAPSETGAS